MRLSKEQQQFTLDIARLVLFAESQCLYLTYGHAWRSPEEQKRLHDAGKSQVLESKHQSRLAVDFNFFKEDGSLTYKWEDVKVLGDFWERLNPKNRWGGDWNKNDIKDGFIDSAHFERNV